MNKPQQCSLFRQRGVALLMMAVFILLITGGVLLSSLSQNNIQTRKQQETAKALAEAKEALLGYAVSYYDNNFGYIGLLPCPDLDANDANLDGKPDYPEGAEHGSCVARNISALGRFPWRTLGLPPLKDAYGECLWYAVSGPFKNASSARTNLLNNDIPGTFEIYEVYSDGTTPPQKIIGNTPEERAIAVIIAPGKHLSGQDRAFPSPPPSVDSQVGMCGGNYIKSNYLDTDSDTGYSNADISSTAGDIDNFITPAPNNTQLNDRLIYITQTEFFAAVRKHRELDDMEKFRALTKKLAECIAQYPSESSNPSEDKRLPWAAPVDLDDYSDDTEYDDETGVSYGRLADTIQDSNHSDPGSSHPSNLVQDCLGNNNEDRMLWKHWKDHFFYEVAAGFRLSSTLPSPTICDTVTCITVNTVNNYIGVVIFSNDPQGSQPRWSQVDKSNISNYVEGRSDVSGIVTYDSSGNDLLYCIDLNLNVAACPS